jgi:glycosyltransferase involved in cell wall biosynthesis
MMPDYRNGNPYQQLLARTLADVDVDVVFPAGYRRGLPIFRAVRDNAPVDLLHLHWTEVYTQNLSLLKYVIYWSKLLLDLWLTRRSGTPVIWTLHNLQPHECRWPRLEIFFRRRLARSVSQVLVHGAQSRTDAVNVLRLPAERVTVAPHGHYRDVYPAVTAEMRCERRRGLADDHRVFLFFGFMRPYKGIERLLRVWEKLQPQNASLWLTGPCLDADYEAKLRRLAEGTPGVRLECGFVEAEGVSRLFAGADIAVLPFERVQTSGSVILALSFGKPVIAPRLGEIPEAVGPATELLYEAGSDEELAAAISRALDCDLEDVTSKSVSACRNVGWDGAANGTVAAYRAGLQREPVVQTSGCGAASAN